MEPFKIFIVEDDPWYGAVLEHHLSLNPDYEVTCFATAKECLARLPAKPNLITLDYSLPDGDGLTVLKQIRDCSPGLPVFIISAQENITTAVELLKQGATEYFVKDIHTRDLLWNAVVRLRGQQTLQPEVPGRKEAPAEQYDFASSVRGASPAMKKVAALVEKCAATNINVSISGETGTGKEIAARAIHGRSARNKKPFVAINMAAIPKDLIESELFGHEKGAFTGAVSRKIGRFEAAHKGTLFLDEIAETDPALQSKLLRVLQERELVRVGGTEKVALDVRLITATHKNLAEEVKKGTFREDLYYRIIGLPLELPPLRERGADILLLAGHFLEEFCKANKMPPVSISAPAREKLMRYSYPGNVRELKAATELAAVMCDGREILPDDLHFTAVSANGLFMGGEKTIREYTIDIITYYLKKYDNNVLKVADRLDIGKSTIYKMVQNREIVLH